MVVCEEEKSIRICSKIVHVWYHLEEIKENVTFFIL